jgi:K+-sensing histidine kinase KdpD
VSDWGSPSEGHVEAHGRSISAMNRSGHGAAFTFTLPIGKDQPLAPEADEFGVSE